MQDLFTPSVIFVFQVRLLANNSGDLDTQRQSPQRGECGGGGSAGEEEPRLLLLLLALATVFVSLSPASCL